MGITGLLPKLASITTDLHIKELEGLTIAVDAYVWLHRGAYSCSRELCENIPTDKYLTYCMGFVDLLRLYKIKPILVFDGGRLPMKGNKESHRHEKRDLNRKKATEHLLKGEISQANECFQKAVDITPAMANNLIQVLRKESVDYIVAPYEADAQLAFLSLNGLADAVITEDSDLIVFGAKRIIYKLDKAGNAKQVNLDNLPKNKEMNFSKFSFINFRHMCLLSGCDYLENIPGVGLMKAHQLISKFKDDLQKLFNSLRKENKLPQEYETNFQKADLTFCHQRVYDPTSRRMVSLRPIPDHHGERDWDFMGPLLADEVVRGIAEGQLDPSTKEPFPELSADAKIYLDRKTKYSKPDEPLPQKNHIMNYFEVKSSSSLSSSLSVSGPKTSQSYSQSSASNNNSQSSRSEKVGPFKIKEASHEMKREVPVKSKLAVEYTSRFFGQAIKKKSVTSNFTKKPIAARNLSPHFNRQSKSDRSSVSAEDCIYDSDDDIDSVEELGRLVTAIHSEEANSVNDNDDSCEILSEGATTEFTPMRERDEMLLDSRDLSASPKTPVELIPVDHDSDDDEMTSDDLVYVKTRLTIFDPAVRKTMNKRKAVDKSKKGDGKKLKPEKSTALDSFLLQGKFQSPFVNRSNRISFHSFEGSTTVIPDSPSGDSNSQENPVTSPHFKRTISGSGGAFPPPKRPPLLSGRSTYVLGVNIGERRIGVGTERDDAPRAALHTSHELSAAASPSRCDETIMIASDCSSQGDEDPEMMVATKTESVQARFSASLRNSADIIPNNRERQGCYRNQVESEYEYEMSATADSNNVELEVKEEAFAEINYSGSYGSSISNNNSNNYSHLSEMKFDSEPDLDASFGTGTTMTYDGNRMESDDSVVACFNRLQDRQYDTYLLNSPEKENIRLGEMSFFFSSNNENAESGIGSQELVMRPKPLFSALSFVPDSPEKKTRRNTHNVELARQY